MSKSVDPADPSDRPEPTESPEPTENTGQTEGTGEDGVGAPVGRRLVLAMLALGAAGIVVGRRLQNGIGSALAPIELHDPTGLISALPIGNTFRYYSVTASVPRANPDTYRLSVSGLVNNEASYSLTDLRALPQTKITRDFQCVTGWRVPQVHWNGVLLRDILTRAEITNPATAGIRFRSFDGAYSESLTLDQALRPDVLVALDMLDKPVTHNHGGPVRMYVAPMYGYKSTKWLQSIEVVDQVDPGYWENRGYDIDAWVGTSNGRDDPGV